MDAIASELQCLYPKMKKDGPIHWTCELIDASNKKEINEVMSRIDSIYS